MMRYPGLAAYYGDREYVVGVIRRADVLTGKKRGYALASGVRAIKKLRSGA